MSCRILRDPFPFRVYVRLLELLQDSGSEGDFVGRQGRVPVRCNRERLSRRRVHGRGSYPIHIPQSARPVEGRAPYLSGGRAVSRDRERDQTLCV